MRVAIVVDKCAPFFTGGYENRYLNIARRLALNHEVKVFTSFNQEKWALDGVQFVRSNLPTDRGAKGVDRSLLHGAAFALQLARSPFGRWLPDVVLVESIPYAHLASMSRWIRDTGSLVVLNVNEAWFEYPYFPGVLSTPSKLAIRYLLGKGLSFSDTVITISRSTAESLATNYGVRDVRVVPMGLDAFQLGESTKDDQRSRKFDYVTVGRVVPIKRQIDFIRALAVLKDRYGWNGRAALVGDGPLTMMLMRAAKELSLEDRLIFLGQLSDEEKFKTLRDSRAFVLCSEREGFSLATLEAQACGAAVIAAKPRGMDVFGVSDIVENEVTGLLYPCGDVDSLVQSLDRLYRDESLRTKLVVNGWHQATHYDWDGIVKEFEGYLTTRRSDSAHQP